MMKDRTHDRIFTGSIFLHVVQKTCEAIRMVIIGHMYVSESICSAYSYVTRVHLVKILIASTHDTLVHVPEMFVLLVCVTCIEN